MNMKEGVTLKLFLLCVLMGEIRGQLYSPRLSRNALYPQLFRRRLRSAYPLEQVSLNVGPILENQALQTFMTSNLGIIARRSPQDYLIPYRRYQRISSTELEKNNFNNKARTDIDSVSNMANPGELRLLGWLFGRPNYSRYPNYSVLEEAAGVGPYYGASRYPSVAHSNSPLMVEDCTEFLDPYTHEIIEECHEAPLGY